MKESFVHRIKIAALLCRCLHGYTLLAFSGLMLLMNNYFYSDAQLEKW